MKFDTSIPASAQVQMYRKLFEIDSLINLMKLFARITSDLLLDLNILQVYFYKVLLITHEP